jgi:hypothetical protein
MWRVSHSVGNLLEARLASTDSGAVSAFLGAIVQAVAVAPSPVVGILDLSELRVFGREDAELFVSVMRRNNPRVKRTAIVVSADALFALQMERLVRAAALTDRRVFRTAGQALAWLTEVLSPEEAAQARGFLTSQNLT